MKSVTNFHLKRKTKPANLLKTTFSSRR